jgi:AraC-like DNA-binding protein
MAYIPQLKPLIENHGGIDIEIIYEKRFTAVDDITHDEQHIHDFYEFYVNLSGDVSFLVENTLYPIRRGDIVITAPNEFHRCVYHNDCVHEHFCIWMKDIPCSSTLLTEEFKKNKLVVLPKDEKETLIELCFSLYKSHTENDILRFGAAASFFEILNLICTRRKNVTYVRELPESFSRIIDYITCNYTDPDCGTATICKRFYISKSTLCRRFQHYFQTTPSDYIESKRFSEAKKQLMSGASVQDACLNSGFSDCSYFIMRFRKKFDITPAKYQKAFSNHFEQ